MIYICKYCKEKKDYKKHQLFACHVRHCKQNYNIDFINIQKKINDKRAKLKKEYTFNCRKCKKEYKLSLTEYAFKNFEKGRHQKHCTQTCANSHIQTKKQNKTRSKKLKGRKIPINIVKKALKGQENTIKKHCKHELKFATMLDNNNIKYTAQKFIDLNNKHYMIDFFIEPNILIEIDGKYHYTTKNHLIDDDKIRDNILINNGYNVIRIKNKDIEKFNVTKIHQ